MHARQCVSCITTLPGSVCQCARGDEEKWLQGGAGMQGGLPMAAHPTGNELWQMQQSQQHQQYMDSRGRVMSGQGLGGLMAGGNGGCVHGGMHLQVGGPMQSQLAAQSHPHGISARMTSSGMSNMLAMNQRSLDTRAQVHTLGNASMKDIMAHGTGAALAVFDSAAQHGAAKPEEREVFAYSAQRMGGSGIWPNNVSSLSSSQAAKQADMAMQSGVSTHGRLQRDEASEEAGGGHRAAHGGDARHMMGEVGIGGLAAEGAGHSENFDHTLRQVQEENHSLRAKVEDLQTTLKRVVQGGGIGGSWGVGGSGAAQDGGLSLSFCTPSPLLSLSLSGVCV